MMLKKYLGLLSIAAAALMFTTTTASAQDAGDCVANFELPVPAENLCVDEGVSSDSTEEAIAFEQLLLESGLSAIEECDDHEDFDACSACAVSAATELSAACSYCYVQHIECVQENCSAECGVNIDKTDDDEACGQCIEETCLDATLLCSTGEEPFGSDTSDSPSEAGDGKDSTADENAEVDDPYGKTCSGGPDCTEDGVWNVAQTGGRLGSCAMTGAGGSLAALLLGLGLVAQRRRH